MTPQLALFSYRNRPPCPSDMKNGRLWTLASCPRLLDPGLEREIITNAAIVMVTNGERSLVHRLCNDWRRCGRDRNSWNIQKRFGLRSYHWLLFSCSWGKVLWCSSVNGGVAIIEHSRSGVLRDPFPQEEYRHERQHDNGCNDLTGEYIRGDSLVEGVGKDVGQCKGLLVCVLRGRSIGGGPVSRRNSVEVNIRFRSLQRADIPRTARRVSMLPAGEGRMHVRRVPQCKIHSPRPYCGPGKRCEPYRGD